MTSAPVWGKKRHQLGKYLLGGEGWGGKKAIMKRHSPRASPPETESSSGQFWLYTPCDLGESIFCFWASVCQCIKLHIFGGHR